MVLLGFAWFLFTLQAADSPLIYTVASAVGGLWGGVFLHLGVSFPSGRLTSARDRGLVIAGYLIIPFAFCRRCCSPRRATCAATTARRTCC